MPNATERLKKLDIRNFNFHFTAQYINCAFLSLYNLISHHP